MKKRTFWQRVKISWRLLLSNKPLQEIYDEGQAPVLADYKTVRDKLTPLIEKLVEKANDNSEGITNVFDEHLLNYKRFVPGYNSLGAAIASERDAPLRFSTGFIEAVNFKPSLIKTDLRIDANIFGQLESARRKAAAELVQYLIAHDFIKHRIKGSPNGRFIDVEFYVNMIEK